MQLVLDRAIAAFSKHGYHGTSIDILKSSTELTAGSLYKAFRDKRQIFAAAFARYIEEGDVSLSKRLAAAANGRERIAETIRFYIDCASGEKGRQGCLVLASLVESFAFDESLRETLVDALGRRRAALIALLREGQNDGSIRSDLPIESCADLLLNLLQGLRAVGKLQDPTESNTLVELALKSID
jgi:AcrR family transcriptional regulator